MKIALVHDYLREFGGAERVLVALHELFPDAPVYTAFLDKKALGIHWQQFAGWDIRETWLADVPFCKQLFSPYRIFAPEAFEDLDLSEFDVVISSSNAYFAKAVTAPEGKHICYCHTPARSLYGYTTMTDWKSNPVTRIFGSIINHYLRIVDFKVAQKVDVFVANSVETQRRIEKFYRRESQVIFPPVQVGELDATARKAATKDGYYLYVNRLAFAKHPEIAVQACSELHLPLKVVGDGKIKKDLEAMAGPSVEFLGAISDQELQAAYKNAKVLLYPVEDEDFGIVPVEAQGWGVPVIAHNSGGPRETVIDGKTGILFDELSVTGVSKAIKKFEKTKFDAKKIHQHAVTFDTKHFKENIKKLVKKVSA